MCSPDVRHYNSVVAAYAFAGLVADTRAAMQKLEAAGFQPSTITYNLLLLAHNNAAQYTGAVTVLAQMQQRGPSCAPDSFTLKHLMRTLDALRLTDDAATKTLHKAMQQAGLFKA